MRERIEYRLELEALRERFPGKAQITEAAAARYLNSTKRKLLKDPRFPVKEMPGQNMVLLTSFAWYLTH